MPGGTIIPSSTRMNAPWMSPGATETGARRTRDTRTRSPRFSTMYTGTSEREIEPPGELPDLVEDSAAYWALRS